MKRLSYLFLLFFVPVAIFAQEVPDQEKSKKEKIKEIKLSENFVYADAVTEDNLSEAQQNSLDLLRTNVNEIFAERLHMPKEDVEEIWDVIEDKCQNVTIKKGDLFRVFTYIMKDYLLPGKRKKKVKEDVALAGKETEVVPLPDEEELGNLSETIVKVTGSDDAEDAVKVEVKEVTETEVTEPEPEVAADLAPEQKLVEVVPSAETEEVVSTTVIASPVTPVEQPIAEVAAPEVEPIVKELLTITTYKDLIKALNEKKDEGVLIYGSVKTMRSPEKCYIAVFKNNEVITFLDKGKKERLNLKTNTPDSLNNYKGNGAILFQIF